MTNEEALKRYREGRFTSATDRAMAYDIAFDALEKQEADGCIGCAFEDVEEWEMPCAKCKRNCKDYWRART